MMWNIAVSGSTYTVALGPRSEKVYTFTGGASVPEENNGSTLTVSGGTYTCTATDGMIATFLSGPTIFFGNAREYRHPDAQIRERTYAHLSLQ